MINIEPLLLRIKNKRLFVIAAPAIVGLFLGGTFVVRPGLNYLGLIKSDIASLQEKVSAYLFVSEGESKLSNHEKRFSGDKAWFIEQINLIAEKSDLSILSVLPEETVKVWDYLEQSSVRIDAESNYHQLGEFVSKLESLDAYVKILSIEIDADSRAVNRSGPGQGPGQRAAQSQKQNVYQISISVGLFTPIAGVL